MAQAVAPAIVASNWKKIGKNSLIGTADITVVKWCLTFKGMMWHQSSGKEWVAFPSKEWTKDGARQFSPIIDWTDRNTADRFKIAALTAIKAIAGEVE